MSITLQRCLGYARWSFDAFALGDIASIFSAL